MITKEIILIFRQILLTSFIRNVWRTVMRICIFRSGLHRFKATRSSPHLRSGGNARSSQRSSVRFDGVNLYTWLEMQYEVKSHVK